MSYPSTLTRGTASFTAGAAKFGAAGRAGGVFKTAASPTGIAASPGYYASATFEAWVKTTTTATKVAVGRDVAFWIGIAGGVAVAHYGNSTASGGSAEQTLTSTAVINDGTFHHLALVFNSAGIGRLYVDGSLAATGTVSGALAGTTTAPASDAIGGFPTNTNYDWAGEIDEVRFSNIERYTGSTYTVPTAALATDANTLALYHLETDGTDSADFAATTLILPNDANIIYSPYNWLVTAGSAKTINSGAYIRALLVGGATSITAKFDLTNDLTPLPQIAFRVDQGLWTSVELSASVVLPIPAGNTWSKHTVEIVVKSTTETQNRWNAPQNTAVVFLGFSVFPDAVTVGASRKRKLNVLCFGDSIAEGVRTLAMTATKDTDRNDSRLAWAYPLGEVLGAEVGVVGFGASGVGASGSGNVPALETAYASLWAGQARSFTPAPDLILIHTGTNGSTSADLTAGMTTLLNGLLAATPASTRIGVMPNWLQRHSAQFQAAIAACSNPKRVRFIDTTGWWSTADASDSLHPYGYINTSDLVPRLGVAARDILAGGGQYLNVAGVAKRVSPLRV